jgi:HAE1 family hydrophobic/amphiphilic exporter-1
MGLTRVAITRPVFMLMVITAMVILGLVSYSRLSAELYPNINPPVVSILTTYPGAGPEDVERLVSRPLEDAVSGIANVKTITSSSKEGSSQITITFRDTADVNVAAIDVERRVSAVRAALPAEADSPTVLKADIAQIPVLYLAYSGDRSLAELYETAKDEIKPRLETQSGVASVSITGGLQREVRVQVNPTRLRAYDLTIDQIALALARENQGVPGGTLEQGPQQTSLRVYGLFQSAAELRELTVATASAACSRWSIR